MQPVDSCTSFLLPFFFFSKLSQTQWLQIIQIYYLTVQQVRSLTWVSLAVFLSLGPWKNVLPCYFQLLGVTHIPWLMGPFLCLQSQQCYVSLAFYLLSQLSLTTAVKVYPLLRNLCDQIVPMWLSQDNLLISKPLTLITLGNSLLLYKLTYLQIPRIRIMDTFGESLFCL